MRTSNENGKLLGQFAARNNFIIKSTCFPHKRIHLGTWRSPGGDITNQIDHVLINARHSSSIIDVRSCRGPNCDSDHYLVKAVLREKIAKVHITDVMKKRNLAICKLKCPEFKLLYQEKLQRKFEEDLVIEAGEERRGDRTTEEEWERIRKAILTTAEEELGTQQQTCNEWFDQECKEVIEEKNNARIKMLHRETRSNCESYRQLRLKANRTSKKRKC